MPALSDLFDMPEAWMPAEQLYDGTGRHLWGFYPPLMVENALTAAYHASKALRPVADSLYRNAEDAGVDLALVWMMPVQLPPNAALPRDVIGALVQAIDDRRTVVVHGDNSDLVAQVRSMVAAFCGGGHA